MVGLYVYITILYCRLYGDVLRVVGGMVFCILLQWSAWIVLGGSCPGPWIRSAHDRDPGRVQAAGSCSGILSGSYRACVLPGSGPSVIRSGSSVLPDQLLPGSCYLDRPVLLHGSGRRVRKKK